MQSNNGGASAATSRARLRSIVVSATIGNALEWYDFLVYGYFASVIAKVFFPVHDEWVSLLLSIGTFSVSFVTRPVGAVVLGLYADRRGRKAALTLSIFMMTAGTLVITLMPGYSRIGLFAPLGILCARLLQGFAVGGEYGSATAFMVEHNPDKRGYAASWMFSSQGMSTILAASIGSALTVALSAEQLQSWGWRVPFALGLLIGPVGYYIRRRLEESPEFLAVHARTTPRSRTAGSGQTGKLLIATGIVALSTVMTYVLQLYMPLYAVRQLHLPAAQSLGIVALNGFLQFALSPVMGALSDRVGPIRVMLTTAMAMAVSVYPMFLWLKYHPTMAWLLGLEVIAGLYKAGYSGPMPALVSEIFPVETRSTGLSFSYSLGVTLFGGFSPFFVTWVIGVTGDTLAPSYYVLMAALISGAALSAVGWRRGEWPFGRRRHVANARIR
ncbi:MFS transporter [Paraburkholderia sp. Ac-20336]|uniref:MFS transporter n=1 Tax=Paraburkholderia sp. Ac-20336 TaxID=2703886 RepID=UPI00197D8480|nr:MFS transporter [Paraburkholderia sp. Ac-20336]MBN3801554.1 MFS transporter [Paraburkholderia sp. Ac-20336]